MKYVDIGVTYRKAVSDGNYGTEAAEVHLSGTLEGEDDAASEIEDMFEITSGLALEQLEKSLSATVRRAVEPPKKVAVDSHGHSESLEDIPF